MLETLEDILEHEKKIAAIRTLLEQVHDDFYENDIEGDSKNIESIGLKEAHMIHAIENRLDDLELISKKRYVKIIQKHNSDIQDKNNEEN